MKKNKMGESLTYRGNFPAVMWCLLIFIRGAICQPGGFYTIYPPTNASYSEMLATKEIRRYFYLRTGVLLAVTPARTLPATVTNAIVVGKTSQAVFQSGPISSSYNITTRTAGLGEQGYVLKTVKNASDNIILVSGVGEAGVLYAAYSLAEKIGVWFNLDGDVLPQVPFSNWSALDALDEVRGPLFELRGTNPFHDFPEGPDWWDLDDYYSYFSQLTKMKMNFMGFHTYPETTPHGAEPQVWIGTPENVNADGTVKKSYRSSLFTTAREKVGYTDKKTGTYAYGASQLFEEDDYGNDVMEGFKPYPAESEYNTLFNRMGDVFNKAFTFARQRGIKTCIGTESPLTVPQAVQADGDVQAFYEGIFTRIKQTHPLDYYWMWTKEEGEQLDPVAVDLNIAYNAAQNVWPELKLAAAGWQLGAGFDALIPKAMAISSINTWTGRDPVDSRYANITGRDKWAIPWFEADGPMVSPQLNVERMYRDARLALQYNCNGIMGLHWRTKEVAPTASALARLGWNQDSWDTKAFYTEWATAHFGPEAADAIATAFVTKDEVFHEVSSRWSGAPGMTTGPGYVVGGGEYGFVGDLEDLRSQIEGAANLERYDYWLNTFRFERSMGENRNDWENMMNYLLASVDTKGTMGVITNLESHSRPDWQGPTAYTGQPRLILTTIRTSVEAGEAMNLKIRSLDVAPPRSVTLYYRGMGQGTYTPRAFTHVNRGVYQVQFPAAQGDLEYYVEMNSSAGQTLRQPVTSPARGHTLVVPQFTDITSVVPGEIKHAGAGTFVSTGLFSGASMTIPFTAERPGKITLNIYDIKGEFIKTLHTYAHKRGRTELNWDGTTDSGIKAHHGIYIMQIQAKSKELP